MRTSHVWCAGHLYRMSVGADALALSGPELRRLGYSGTAVVVTDETVAGLFGDEVDHSLRGAEFRPEFVVLSPGEEQKSIDTAVMLYDRLNQIGAERSTPLIALGGGVIGDLAGFVAATYFRGLPLLHAPTTLLAQLDSSIGGKVAVNHGGLKNNVGAFHQPAAIIADTACLKYLPERQFRNGLAESIKSAVIRDEAFFCQLEADMARIMQRDMDALEHIVSVTARIKASVIEEDERDAGLRNILNYGHTIGHGIEAASGFSLCHGECVSIGMVIAGRIAVALGSASSADNDRQERLLLQAGLPVSVPEQLGPEAIFSAMLHDKKMRDSRLRFVLMRRIGEASLRNDVPHELVKEALLSACSVA